MKLIIHLHLVAAVKSEWSDTCTPHMPSTCAHGHFLRHSHKELPLLSRGKSSGNESAFAAVFVTKRTYVSLYKHFLMYAGMPIRSGGNRNARSFQQEFEFMGILQIPKRCAIECV